MAGTAVLGRLTWRVADVVEVRAETLRATTLVLGDERGSNLAHHDLAIDDALHDIGARRQVVHHLEQRLLEDRTERCLGLQLAPRVALAIVARPIPAAFTVVLIA